jgi:hypothetical protein
MTFDELMEILKSTKTDYQKAADIHAAIQTASRPSAMAIQPMKQRKARTATPKPKSPASDSLNGFAGHVENEATNAN